MFSVLLQIQVLSACPIFAFGINLKYRLSFNAFLSRPPTNTSLKGNIFSKKKNYILSLKSKSFITRKSKAIIRDSMTNSSKSVGSVLFDFDGTLGDTETPAMEVAFWELAPYLTNLPVTGDPEELETCKLNFIRNNAGRAFEFMIEDVDEERKKEKMDSDIETAWSSFHVSDEVAAICDAGRAKFGLPSCKEVHEKKTYSSLLDQQKQETNISLATAAKPNPGVMDGLSRLESLGITFCIATTSGKPRVPISVVACKFEHWFPIEKIHSGESDFNPPEFKPSPAVYLLAASKEGKDPKVCVAVEDSASGVGSAANAELGLILGYVGSSHIEESNKEKHANVLLAGAKSQNGRGAEIVCLEFSDVILCIEWFMEKLKTDGPPSTLEESKEYIHSLKSVVKHKYWVKN